MQLKNTFYGMNEQNDPPPETGELQQHNINPYPAELWPITHFKGMLDGFATNPDAYRGFIAGRVMIIRK